MLKDPIILHNNSVEELFKEVEARLKNQRLLNFLLGFLLPLSLCILLACLFNKGFLVKKLSPELYLFPGFLAAFYLIKKFHLLKISDLEISKIIDQKLSSKERVLTLYTCELSEPAKNLIATQALDLSKNFDLTTELPLTLGRGALLSIYLSFTTIVAALVVFLFFTGPYVVSLSELAFSKELAKSLEKLLEEEKDLPENLKEKMSSLASTLDEEGLSFEGAEEEIDELLEEVQEEKQKLLEEEKKKDFEEEKQKDKENSEKEEEKKKQEEKKSEDKKEPTKGDSASDQQDKNGKERQEQSSAEQKNKEQESSAAGGGKEKKEEQNKEGQGKGQEQKEEQQSSKEQGKEDKKQQGMENAENKLQEMKQKLAEKQGKEEGEKEQGQQPSPSGEKQEGRGKEPGKNPEEKNKNEEGKEKDPDADKQEEQKTQTKGEKGQGGKEGKEKKNNDQSAQGLKKPRAEELRKQYNPFSKGADDDLKQEPAELEKVITKADQAEKGELGSETSRVKNKSEARAKESLFEGSFKKPENDILNDEQPIPLEYREQMRN